MARLTEYDFDLCVEICELVADGGHIMNILANNDNYPTWSTFRRWKRDNDELRTLYINAQQDKTEAITNNIENVRKDMLTGKIEPSAANVSIQTDKWFCAKFYPKMFGDKIQQEHSGEVKTTTTVIRWGNNEVEV